MISTTRGSLWLFFLSLIFAFTPFIIIVVGLFLGIFDVNSTTDELSVTRSISKTALITLPVGLLVALYALINAFLRHQKSKGKTYDFHKNTGVRSVFSSLLFAGLIWLGVAIVGGIVTIFAVIFVDQLLGTTIEAPVQPLIAELIGILYYCAQALIPGIYLYRRYRGREKRGQAQFFS